jgi:hypothetical protein
MISRLLLAAMVTLGMVGCASEDEPVAVEEFQSENDVRPTYNGDLKLLGSYHELFDKSGATTCVQYEDGGQYARVGEPSRNLSIELVREKEELARKLGVDLNVKARYAAIGGNAAVNLLDEFSNSANSITFLLSAQADYLVRNEAGNGRSLVLSPKGLAALNKGAATFAQKCGTHYASGVRYGARFYLLINYKAMDHMAKTQMEASLGVDGSIAGSGDVKTRLETTAKMSGVQVTVKAASSGFWLEGQPSAEVIKAMESANVDANLFAAASQLYMGMIKSVERDYCLDAGQGTCNGQASPGYFARTRRDTNVTGVQLAGYQGLSNATANGKNSALAKVQQRVEVVNRFIRAYSEIQVRMDNIYFDEVKPFLDATPQQKALYNVAPPGKPLATPEAVYAVAQDLDERIFPPTGGVMGTLREEVSDRISECLDKVAVDITASCTAGDKAIAGVSTKKELEAEQTLAWNELYAFFDAYHATQRILPLQLAVGEWPITSKSAQTACDAVANKLNTALGQKGSTTKIVYRLATKDEVRWLAPFLSHGNVSWSSADLPNATWYTPVGSNPCGSDYPYFQNQPSGAPIFGCSTNDWWDEDLVTLCVPSSGPVPLVAPQ